MISHHSNSPSAHRDFASDVTAIGNDRGTYSTLALHSYAATSSNSSLGNRNC
jgi:hypothetical protein